MFGSDFMKKIQDAQAAMNAMQEKMAITKVEYSAGGGMVTVLMNGKRDLLNIVIDKKVVDPNDIEMLQDLIVAAINGASDKVEQTMKDEMGGLLSDMGLPLGM